MLSQISTLCQLAHPSLLHRPAQLMRRSLAILCHVCPGLSHPVSRNLNLHLGVAGCLLMCRPFLGAFRLQQRLDVIRIDILLDALPHRDVLVLQPPNTPLTLDFSPALL